MSPKKLVLPWYFKWAYYWEIAQLIIILPILILCSIFNVKCTAWLLMSMMLAWVAVIIPVCDVWDHHNKMMKNCILKKIPAKKRSAENYRHVRDLYYKYREQTELRVGTGIGYLCFVLIPILLEYFDDDHDLPEYKVCIWYWHVAFLISIPILILSRGFEHYCKV